MKISGYTVLSMILPSGSKSWKLGVHIRSAINSYLILLLMQPTLKVLKHVNCHPRSSEKIINETGKTLHNHF